MTLPPLKNPIIGGKWHIIVEMDLTSESLAGTTEWLAQVGDEVRWLVTQKTRQLTYKVRVQNVQCHFPEMTGEGYDEVPQG